MGLKESQDVFCVAAQARIPTLLHSRPGHGKTTFINEVAPQLGFVSVYTLLGSIIDRTDVAGIPVRVEEEGIFKYLPHGASKQLQDPRSMLFLDELTGAPDDVQNAMLRVVLEQVMGEVKLRCYVAGACNPPSMAAGGNELSHAMAARWLHIDWVQRGKEFTDGLRTQWKGKSVYRPPLLPVGWESGIGKWAGMVADFLDNRPELVDVFNENAYPPAAANPRTWYDYAVRWLAASEAANLSKTKVQLGLAGCVGEGPAQELVAYVKVGGDVMALIANPKLIAKSLKGKDADVVDAFLSAVNENWQTNQIDDAKLAQCYDYSTKAGLPVDIIWAAFSRVKGAKNQSGAGLGTHVRDAITRAIQAKL